MSADALDEELTGETCCFCGELERLWLFEIWEERDFQIGTCCEGLHEALCAQMAEDPDYALELLRELGAEAVCDRRLRRVPVMDGWHIRLDWKSEAAQPCRRDTRL